MKPNLSSPWTIGALFVALGAALLFMRASSPRPLSTAPAFDVPSLLGKDISGVLQTATDQGAHVDPDALKNAKREFPSWDMNFKRDGYTLTVSFVPATGKVKEFFMQSNESDGAQSDLEPLRQAAGLDRLPSSCRVQPIPATSQPGEYTGIVVTPP